MSKALYNQLMRWWETITDLDFEIQHRPGRIHGNADSLSQYPYPNQTTSAEVMEEDKQMYNQLGLKVPSGLHRKGGSTEQGVNIVTRSKAVSHRDGTDLLLVQVQLRRLSDRKICEHMQKNTTTESPTDTDHPENAGPAGPAHRTEEPTPREWRRGDQRER